MGQQERAGRGLRGHSLYIRDVAKKMSILRSQGLLALVTWTVTCAPLVFKSTNFHSDVLLYIKDCAEEMLGRDRQKNAVRKAGWEWRK